MFKGCSGEMGKTVFSTPVPFHCGICLGLVKAQCGDLVSVYEVCMRIVSPLFGTLRRPTLCSQEVNTVWFKHRLRL